MKKNGVVLVGTDYLALGGNRAVWIDRLKRAQRIGVTMAYGTDVIDAVPGQTRGTESMRGIEPWIEAGIPAPVLLRAMTTNAAKLMGTEKQRGAIAVGLAADIIAMPGNPLEDATALKKVSFVMKDGTVIKK
jgi:imidazolonepropionase-like amidohydrolase